MNILVPDSWLREYLKTTATPEQLKEYVSLCGPSIERINKVGDKIVYDIEITSNRPDSMSIFGIAREAAAILPQFGIDAELHNDPYRQNTSTAYNKYAKLNRKKLSIMTDLELNPRWTSVVLENVRVGKSPAWIQNYLETTGIRPINNVIDITNYLMREYGQPAHAFDYDSIGAKKGTPTMILRESRVGERITTLDGKSRDLPGGDIVIEDGDARLIDLCGIMGGLNSSITEKTRNVVLFMQTYNPTRIRKTSMSLSLRTEAATLFEKGLDPELVLPTVLRGVELMKKFTGARVASKVYDLYPKPFKPYIVLVKRQKINAYLNTSLNEQELKQILEPLGFSVTVTHEALALKVPSFRRDIEIDVDIIEEIARIYGYHRISSELPHTPPALVHLDPVFGWEEEVKLRLRDWGFTETYTYSMISEKDMAAFGFNTTAAYKIANPLSSEWVYMRPSLFPNILKTVAQNLHIRDQFKLFELSMIYKYRSRNLPDEIPVLDIVWPFDVFLEAKGIAEAIFDQMGIALPNTHLPYTSNLIWDQTKSFTLGVYGGVGRLNREILEVYGIKSHVTALELDFSQLVKDANRTKTYTPIPRNPPIIEDLSFILPEKIYIGNVMQSIYSVSPLVYRVNVHDRYENTVTFRIIYLRSTLPLSTFDLGKVRKKIVTNVSQAFNGQFKGQLE
ncbi:phenylalanine--tRNA ligase subunit beta [Candidatus Gottesmanbacteria bacterium]|nr:phenylalanine--tRNA ligase subunit beta [Candidatus Gottesmanbacteria bacterium]